MIPVSPRKEPKDFEQSVRVPGRKWLQDNNIDPDKAPSKATELPPYWRKCQKGLWESYGGICAYLCIYFEWPLGAGSTDHFVAKSREAGMAYEWKNFRLSCLGMNRKKNRFDDILDPFEVEPETFLLNLVTGEIQPNPELSPVVTAEAKVTIQRLGLNDPEIMEMRATHYAEFIAYGLHPNYFARRSPFVWHEARRQGLL